MIDFTDLGDAKRPLAFFEELSRIPHGSGNTALIADHLVRFAAERGLEHYRDETNNVIIKKPATVGYEHRPTVIFQGHLDMVAEKKLGAEIDMEREGLTLYRDGDLLRAQDTTLGGDDGVALAYALAVLDADDIPHPAFEAVFTSDEETGLIGATALDPSLVKGRLLINIDSDVEGVFTVGCAGGVRSDLALGLKREDARELSVINLSLCEFKGGHSGVEIDKGRINAIKALAEVLGAIDTRIVTVSGGNADNAIPRDVTCKLAYTDRDKLLSELEKMRMRYAELEPDIIYALVEESEICAPLAKESSDTLISLLSRLPSGVIAMSEDIDGLVETSLNLGILRCLDDLAEVSFSVRSAKGAKKRELCERLASIAKKHGASYGERGEYPAWEYRADSHLRDVCVRIYEDMYGKSPEVLIIHAGLECGILSEKIEGLDCISIGPDNYDIHTVEERLSLPSFARVWDYLKRVLKEV